MTARKPRAKAVKVRDRRSVGERLVTLFAPWMTLEPEIRELPVVRKRAKAK